MVSPAAAADACTQLIQYTKLHLYTYHIAYTRATFVVATYMHIMCTNQYTVCITVQLWLGEKYDL